MTTAAKLGEAKAHSQDFFAEEKPEFLRDSALAAKLPDSPIHQKIVKTPSSIAISHRKVTQRGESITHASQYSAEFVEAPLSITKHDELNFLTRWLEIAKFTMAELQCFYDSVIFHLKGLFNADHPPADNPELTMELQGGVLLATGTGLIVGILGHYYFRRWYNPRSKLSMNPLYRNFKTLASVGAQLGIVIGYLLPLPRPMQKIAAAILMDICCLSFGLLAFPYWLLREKVFKIDNTKSNFYARVGKNDGWSKYGKAAFVFGIVIFQMISGLYAWGTGGNVVISMLIGGGLGGVIVFAASIIGVPLVNWISYKLTKKRILVTDHKDTYRSNYLRSGITGFLALGMVVGFVVGTVICPGLGSMAGMTLFGAIFATIGGIFMGVAGGRISLYAKRKFGLDDNADTDNDVDYTTRNCSYLGGFAFAAIFFFLPIPGGPLIAAALGTAVGGTIGWCFAFKVMQLARKIDKDEEKVRSRPDDQATLAWTQRVAATANFVSIIGAIVGFCVGLAFGPMGAILGSAFCFALGGFVGGVIGALIDPTARRIMKEVVFGTTKRKINKLVKSGELNLVKMEDTHHMYVKEDNGITYYNIQYYLKERENKLRATAPEPSAPAEKKCNKYNLSFLSKRINKSHKAAQENPEDHGIEMQPLLAGRTSFAV